MKCQSLLALFFPLLMLPGLGNAADPAIFAGYAHAAVPIGHGSVAAPATPASVAAPASPTAAPIGHGSVAAPTAPASVAAPAGHAAVAASTGKPQPQPIPEKMSCGVCGMYPASFPLWQTEIIFKNGKMVPFDGPKDMFKYLMNMVVFNKEQARADVAALWVKRHDNATWIDGETAYYVVGSSATGPMGAELVPFDSQVAAKGFQAKSGGMIKRYPEITIDMVSKLAMAGGK